MKLVIVSRFITNDKETTAKVHIERIPVAASTTPENVYNAIREIQKGFLAIQATKGKLESVVDDSLESITETDFGFVTCRVRHENGDIERCDFHTTLEW